MASSQNWNYTAGQRWALQKRPKETFQDNILTSFLDNDKILATIRVQFRSVRTVCFLREQIEFQSDKTT